MQTIPEKVRKTVREFVKTNNFRTLSGEKHEIQGGRWDEWMVN